VTAPLNELKTRARLRLNAAKREGSAAAEDLRLRDCLNQVSRDAGFAHWEHARQVLGGLAAPGEDMGSFWHAPHTGILLNLWFAKYEQARAALDADPAAFLLPYRRQFMVVQDDFVRELGVDPGDAAWARVGHDLVRGYGSADWEQLALRRLKAPLSTFAPG
jgi:hypothetical protein